MHVFYAQGGGLGHLTRIDRLIKTLDLPANKVIIITPSVFTAYFKDYTFSVLLWNAPVLQWTKTIIGILQQTSVTTFYVDAFPFGLKGELSVVYEVFPQLKTIYIARLLKWDFYHRNSIVKKQAVLFSETLILEHLYPEHLKWITKHSENVRAFQLKIEKPIAIAYSKMPYVLVVHSGGKAAVLKLCNQAIKDYKDNTAVKIVVFTQVSLDLENPKFIIHKNRYPVSQYFEHAVKLYTGAGFNIMQELRAYKKKHFPIAFDKHFDDQHFRLKNTKKTDY